MKKRGASGKAVITLIVLIALVLIAILWFVIFPIFGGSHQRNIDLSIVTANDFTVYDPDTKLASVEIARGDDNEALIGFDIVFDVNGKKIDYKVNSEKVLSPGTSKVYKFDLADYTEPDSVSIYPIFEGSGFFGSGGYTGNVVFIIAEATLGKTGIDEPVISQVSPPGKRLSTGSGITGNVVGACGSFSTTAPCPAGQIRCSADGLCKQITCIKSNCFVTCGSGCPVHIPTDFNDPNYCPIGMDSCVNDGTGCTYPCSGSVVVPVVADWNTRNACTSDARCEGGPGSCISGVCGGPINIPDLPCGGADFNGDGIVNGTDIAIFNSHVGMANPTMNDGDLNGDGAVISGSSSNLNSDWRIMMHTLGMTCTPRSVTNPGGGGCAILDAKLCPDGSYVGRVPPSCAFATCPVINGVIEEGTDITDSGVTIPLDLGVVITSGDILSATIECVLNSA
ncbi:MAG: hypothetical protein WCP89_02990, partial [archaeon]